MLHYMSDQKSVVSITIILCRCVLNGVHPFKELSELCEKRKFDDALGELN